MFWKNWKASMKLSCRRTWRFQQGSQKKNTLSDMPRTLLPYTAMFWALFTVLPFDALWRVTVQFATLTTTLTMLLCGFALIYVSKPRRIKNVLWLPFIYFYWIFQAFIALYAAFLILLRRPKRWNKTDKKGVVNPLLHVNE